jgi:hypothetical protein
LLRRSPGLGRIELYYLPSYEAAARSLKVAPIAAPVHSDAEIKTVIISLSREPRGGLAAPGGRFPQEGRGAWTLGVLRGT